MNNAQHYYSVNMAAADYNCGTYGAGSFGNSTCATTGTGSAGHSQTAQTGGLPGLLADTGMAIILPVSLALAIIIAASILLFRRLRRQSSTN